MINITVQCRKMFHVALSLATQLYHAHVWTIAIATDVDNQRLQPQPPIFVVASCIGLICRLTGTLPRVLGVLNNLQSVDLSRNRLSGFLPNIWGQLPNLTAL